MASNRYSIKKATHKWGGGGRNHKEKRGKKDKNPRNATQTCPRKETKKKGGTQNKKKKKRGKRIENKNREKTPAGLDISSDNNKARFRKQHDEQTDAFPCPFIHSRIVCV
jgi:hypothetical protein